MLPVKKAFMQFDIKSLVPPNSSAVQNVKTLPSSKGCNPTINTLVKFKVPLPKEELYCPKLACTVYDYVFPGMSQPVIGTFTIPLAKLKYDLIKLRAEEE